MSEQKAMRCLLFRFVRCKYVMGGTGKALSSRRSRGDGPMDSLKATFSDAYDNSLTTLKPIHERQEEIERQPSRLRRSADQGEFAQGQGQGDRQLPGRHSHRGC